MNCESCGRKIKNIYTWDGKIYGIECWKVIALPELEKQRQMKNKEWDDKKVIAVEVARIKDLSKIKNEFKTKIIKNVIMYYDENKFITKKQYDLLTDQFNKQDRVIMYDMRYDMGLIDYETYLNRLYHNTTGKRNQEIKIMLDEHYEELHNDYLEGKVNWR